jgi:hypothetical protein
MKLPPLSTFGRHLRLIVCHGDNMLCVVSECVQMSKSCQTLGVVHDDFVMNETR